MISTENAKDAYVGGMCSCGPSWNQPEVAHSLPHPVEGCECPPSTVDTRVQMNGEMPNFRVDDKPIFAGILSYESPLSLNNSLHNWLEHDLFHRIAAQDVFLQINHRSERDNEVVDAFQRNKLNGKHPMTVMGSPEENLNPGLTISKFCRLAEQHPSSHPNGENLLLFLEKDWILEDHWLQERSGKLESVFQSAKTLSERGVHYFRLQSALNGINRRSEVTWGLHSRDKYASEHEGEAWMCAAEGRSWACTTAHQHRWTNLPSIIDCKWFLRYLEPFAIMTGQGDPVMACGRKDGYCDWEKALQDGRIAWTNSQW